MQAGEGHLGRARQVQVVALDVVDVDVVRGQEARPVHGLLADEHGRQHRDEALLDEPVEREAVERELDQRRVAHAVDEARAGEAGRRAPGRTSRGPSRSRGGRAARSRSSRRLADLAQHLRVLLGPAVGRGRIRRVRDAVPVVLHARLRLLELVLERLQLALDPRQLLELLRRRLALELRARAEVVDLRLELPPPLVGAHQLIEELLSALARDRGPNDVGMGARCLEVDHAAESKPERW